MALNVQPEEASWKQAWRAPHLLASMNCRLHGRQSEIAGLGARNSQTIGAAKDNGGQ